jgi:predicted tellurium resistance membrane protein TerC
LFTIFAAEISGRDLILICGGLFLIWKSTMEIHEKLEGDETISSSRVSTTFGAAIVQILLLDIVFSLDSIITALGMASQLAVMVAAVVIAVGFMMLFSGKISAFVEKHPTIKMLALSFLLLIGVALIGDGFDMHIPKGYIYFAMAFSVLVEMLNLKMRPSTPVKLHQPHLEQTSEK